MDYSTLRRLLRLLLRLRADWLTSLLMCQRPTVVPNMTTCFHGGQNPTVYPGCRERYVLIASAALWLGKWNARTSLKKRSWKPRLLSRKNYNVKFQGAAPALLYRKNIYPPAPITVSAHRLCRDSGGPGCGAGCRVRPLLGWGSLFLLHGLCFPLMMSPLSELPVDLHHSSVLIKPPFMEAKQGKKVGKTEKGEERMAVMEAWRGRGDGRDKIEQEADMVKGRQRTGGLWWRRGHLRFLQSGVKRMTARKSKEQKNYWVEVKQFKVEGKKWEVWLLPSRLLICWSKIIHQVNRSSCLSLVSMLLDQTHAAEIQRASSGSVFFFPPLH